MTPISVLCLVNMASLLIIAFIGFPYLLSEKDSIDYIKIAGGCYRALLATIAVTLGAYYYFDRKKEHTFEKERDFRDKQFNIIEESLTNCYAWTNDLIHTGKISENERLRHLSSTRAAFDKLTVELDLHWKDLFKNDAELDQFIAPYSLFDKHKIIHEGSYKDFKQANFKSFISDFEGTVKNSRELLAQNYSMK